MDTSVMITLGFLVFAIVMFAWEKIPLSITAMVVAVGLHLSGVLSAKEAFAGFVDPNVLLFMGMFVIGEAFFATGVAVGVGNVVHKFAKTETSLLVAVMMITGILSGFLSNTGTAAVLIPVIIGICKKSGFKQTKLLMPLVLVATNVISESAAVRSIDMKTIMLFAGSMALGDAMVKTGTGSVIADLIVNSLGASPSPIVVLVVIFALGVFMTNFMSNTATCALLVPIGLSLASQLGFDPKAVLAAIVIASSLAYATPIGMPANTMVYNIAGYSFMDYVKAGLPLIVVSSIVALVLLPILFPF